MWAQKRNHSKNPAQFVHCIKNSWTRRKGGEGGEGKGEDEDGAQSESASPVCPDLEARRLKWPLLLFGPSLSPVDCCPIAHFPSLPEATSPFSLHLPLPKPICHCILPMTHHHCPWILLLGLFLPIFFICSSPTSILIDSMLKIWPASTDRSCEC